MRLGSTQRTPGLRRRRAAAVESPWTTRTPGAIVRPDAVAAPADAFTPTIGFATRVVSVTVVLFFALIGFVFWITSLHDRPDFKARTGKS